MIFEIRSYHYDPDQFEAYCQWVREEAAPFLKTNMDVVGVWIDSGETPEIWGSDPAPLKYGTANLTWIIRWKSMDHRSQGHKEVFDSEEWQTIWSHHPDSNGYLHCEVTFATEI
jgi:hypothetical protein